MLNNSKHPTNQFPRRDFIRRAMLALAGGAAGLVAGRPQSSTAGAAASTPSLRHGGRLKFSLDIREGLQPRRVTNAMWDYSWLTQHYPGGAFANFDRAADELAERGFNTVRIDAFPFVIGALKSHREEITIPADPLANWGMSDRDRGHAVAEELVSFMQAVKRRGLYVILSSWGKECKEYAGRRLVFAKDRCEFRKSWERTLDLLGSRDLLDHVLYVDLDQEFPYFSPYLDELNGLANQSPAGGSLEAAMQAAGELKPPGQRPAWTPSQINYVHALFSEMLSHFQWRYPRLRFTYSLTSYFKEVRSMALQLFDVLELHLWIHSPRFENRTGFNRLVKDRDQHDYKDYARRLAATMDTVGPMLAKEMQNQIAFAKAWSEEIAAPVVTTEAWGPWWHMDHSDLDWDWLKNWCEESMNAAARNGFWGVTPWNYSHPYWKNWADVKWYRKVNQRFLRS
jgi:hypothetical protein